MKSYKKSLNWNIIANKIKYFYSNDIGMIPLVEKLE